MARQEELFGFLLIVAGLLISLKTIGDATASNVIDFITRKPVGSNEFTTTLDLNGLYEKYGVLNGVNPNLLKALAIVESNERPNAKNPRDPSIGIMQIFCENDGPNSPCKNKLNVLGWDQATPERLFDPDFNISIGSQIIAWNIQTYGFNRGIAVYNSFSARLDAPDGPFVNNEYVNKVLGELAILEGAAF